MKHGLLLLYVDINDYEHVGYNRIESKITLMK